MDLPLPNRLAVYLTGAIALLAGILPLIGNLDWESTAGVIAGLSAIAVVVREWLVNWGKWDSPVIQQIVDRLLERNLRRPSGIGLNARAIAEHDRRVIRAQA